MTPVRFSQRWQALRFWLALLLLATSVVGGAAAQAAFLRQRAESARPNPQSQAPAAEPTAIALQCRVYLPNIQSYRLLANLSGTNGVPTGFQLNGSTCATPSGATPTPVTPTAVPPAASGLIGFATINALGQNGTTGGAGGTTVTVTTAAQLLDYIARSGAYIIQVNATITLSSMHQVTSDKTIVGVGTAGTITGGGLTMVGVKNVIIRNLTFTNASDDSIDIEQSAHHIWIDHNDFSNGYDGLVDIKRGSDYVTVSWNHFHNHDKTMLLGHDDGNSAQDLGHLRVTYHHNWFDGSVQRHPRVRFAEPVHVFNNYYVGNSGYGVASTVNAGVLVEGNYFDGVGNPTVIQTGASDPGRLVQRQNMFVNSGTPQSSGSVIEPSTYYSYTLDSAANIPSIVTNGAGVGKI
jgi:pectate lyase